MRVEKFEEKDYPMLLSWWEKHKHPVIAREALSPLGLICYVDEVPSCVSFIYMMPMCNLAQIAWTTSNPEVSPRIRHKAISYCIKGLFEIAQKYERYHVVCFSGSTGLSKLLGRYNLGLGKSHDFLYGRI